MLRSSGKCSAVRSRSDRTPRLRCTKPLMLVPAETADAADGCSLANKPCTDLQSIWTTEEAKAQGSARTARAHVWQMATQYRLFVCVWSHLAKGLSAHCICCISTPDLPNHGNHPTAKPFTANIADYITHLRSGCSMKPVSGAGSSNNSRSASACQQISLPLAYGSGKTTARCL